jgi:hypothetical protein
LANKAKIANYFNGSAHWAAPFGGTFAGHGVYVTGGNARFILKQYSVSQ